MSRAHSCDIPPALLWSRLVDRSIQTWEIINLSDIPQPRLANEILRQLQSLDDFLREAPKSLMFWFFQRRDVFLTQERISKWNPERLEDYVLLPAQNGYVSRRECFFISHFWLSADDPDPEGEYLRLNQGALREERWSFVWLDWSCMPQSPRTNAEEQYFLRSLETMSGIIRNCGFMYFYPPWKPRLWILYEIAENYFTSYNSFDEHPTPDIETFVDHVKEMIGNGVPSVLRKYGYECSFVRDRAFLTSWLELLVLLRRLNVDLLYVRRALDFLTWSPMSRNYYAQVRGGALRIEKFAGRLEYWGQSYSFLPFPQWVSLSLCPVEPGTC